MNREAQRLYDSAALLRSKAKQLTTQAKNEAALARRLEKLSSQYENELHERLGKEGRRKLMAIRQQLEKDKSAAEDDNAAVRAREMAEQALDQLIASHGVTREELSRISQRRLKSLIATPAKELLPPFDGPE